MILYRTLSVHLEMPTTVGSRGINQSLALVLFVNENVQTASKMTKGFIAITVIIIGLLVVNFR